MADSEDGWSRLRALLEEAIWDRERATFIIAGLDPETTLPIDVPARFVWLPDGLRPEWSGLTGERLETRALDVFSIVQTMFQGLPSLMAPYAWLSEAMRERPARPGIVPPWFERARARKGLKPLLPPDPRARINARARRWDGPKSRIRQLWDAWRFDEAEYENQGDFIKHAMKVEKAHCPDFRLIEQWLKNWRLETGVIYGDFPRVGATLEDQRGESRMRRGYGHPAFAEKPKAGRPKRK
jgi:hypothetical protein